MNSFLRNLWLQDDGGEIAEYATIMATILVLVVGTLRLVGLNSGGVFSSVAAILSSGANPAH